MAPLSRRLSTFALVASLRGASGDKRGKVQVGDKCADKVHRAKLCHECDARLGCCECIVGEERLVVDKMNDRLGNFSDDLICFGSRVVQKGRYACMTEVQERFWVHLMQDMKEERDSLGPSIALNSLALVSRILFVAVKYAIKCKIKSTRDTESSFLVDLRGAPALKKMRILTDTFLNREHSTRDLGRPHGQVMKAMQQARDYMPAKDVMAVVKRLRSTQQKTTILNFRSYKDADAFQALHKALVFIVNELVVYLGSKVRFTLEHVKDQVRSNLELHLRLPVNATRRKSVVQAILTKTMNTINNH